MYTRLLFFLCLLTSLNLQAQNAPQPLSADERNEVVDSIGAILEREYVFPEIGQQINQHLHQRSKDGAYNAIEDPMEFANILTEDVRAINNDLHMRVRFDPQMIADFTNAVSPEDSINFMRRQAQNDRANNYGFQEVKILDGNIGYLQLTGFYGVTEEAGKTAEATMNFLSNTDALIIDLRANGGGSPAMIQLITSYLYGPEPVHLNTFYYRPQDEYSQTWTLPYVPGTRRPDVDVYVLTSGQTFSAAEEFSYNLRNLERATLVGEVTGGGAHPGGTRIATERFTVWVPSGRAINPITNTNWEGTGVQPHVEVPADDALLTARILATEKLMEQGNEATAFQYEWALAGLHAEKEPVSLDQELLRSYEGNYGPRVLTYEDGHLYYQREGRAKYQLVPMTENIFQIPEIPYFRLRVDSENGTIMGLTGMYDNGSTDHSPKSDKP